MIDTQDTARKIRTDIFVHTSKESNFELGERLGLTGEALENFKYACYEVKLSVLVDMETGDTEIVAVDDEALTKVIELPERKGSHFMLLSEGEADALHTALIHWQPVCFSAMGYQESLIKRLSDYIDSFAEDQPKKRPQLMEDEGR